jgi:hypothetical protein
VPIVLKPGSRYLLEPSRPVKACNGIVLPLPLLYITMAFPAPYVEGNLLLSRIVQETEIKFSININDVATKD